jgi:predicted N-acyltransferase
LNYRMQVFERFAQVPADAWGQLLAASPLATPFMQADFLLAMETSLSACPDTGWQARPALLFDESDRVVGAVPLFAKGHSYGEYVFDWAWARAYEEAGLPYFPKWLVASPFSPVPGSRLLAAGPEARLGLAAGLTDLVRQSGWSSAHVLFGHETDHQALSQAGWLLRKGVQFHWQHRGYRDFNDFLESLTQPKRKKIRAERRRVAEAGITCSVTCGQAITDADWAFFYRCYCQTYFDRGNPPYLTEAFFEQIRRSMPETLVLAMAHRGSTPVACALLLRGTDQGRSVAYGRYWGAVEQVPMLHFELAYYTPLEWAISSGIDRIEGGAQGEHKMARGFDPVETWSSHWISRPEFRDAVARFLAREQGGVDAYLSELDDRRPFRGEVVSQGLSRPS